MRAPTLACLLLLAASPASAQPIPGGQYSVVISGFGKDQVSSWCMAETTREKAMTPVQEMTDCSKREITPDGPNGYRMNVVCEGMTMNGTARMIGDTAYHSEVTVEIEGMAPVKTVTDVKRTGPCKPGEKPVNAP